MTDNHKQGAPDAPLVSVIVRTTNRPQLAKALESIALQNYRPLELVLVDAIGEGLDGKEVGECIPDDLSVVLVNTGTPLPRAQAANAGLDASHGKYLLFLDEDDWIAREHIAGLVDTLNASTGINAVYSSTRKTDVQGNLLDERFDRAYDPVLLKRDNYIPIHAVLFARSLVESGCRFDETLDIYEDWDFWLQVSRKTEFLHLNQETAFYRQGGDSETDITNHEIRTEPGHRIADARIRIYTKWSAKWDGAEINDFVSKTVSRGEFEANCSALDRKNRENSELNSFNSSLRLMLNKTTKDVEFYARKAREHAISNLHRDRNIRDLENTLDKIYHSLSWRLMGPFRRLNRLIDQLLLPIKQRVHFYRHGTELIESDELQSRSEHERVTGDQQKLGQMKARFLEQAEANLQELLASDNKLVFPRSENPRVSILLVLYNQAPLTLLCLESIIKFAPVTYELVIVDNNSRDLTEELLTRVSNVTLVRNSSNEGFVTAINKGLEHCRGKYLLLLNNDAMLHLYSVESAIRTLENTPDAGAVGGRIVLLDGSLQEAGSIIFNDGSCLGYGRHGDPEAPEYMFQRPVDYCSAAFLLCETGLFREMGGFDTDYAPAYYEDSDFCVRLQERGLKVIYDPNAVITHYEFASSGSQVKAEELQNTHRRILLEKHSAYLEKQHPADPGRTLFTRTANDFRNVLIIDDRVPYTSMGSGYPRCREIVSLLSQAELNVSLYPLQFPEETWLDTYGSLPANVEVLLGLGVHGLVDFLHQRRGFFDTVIVSRTHNMLVVNELLSQQPKLLDGVRLIYDAEAITAMRDIRKSELHGQMLKEDEKQELIEREIHASRTADIIVTVSASESAVYDQYGYNNTVVLGHSLKVNPTPGSFGERNGLLFVGALRDEESPNVDSLHWFINAVWPLLKDDDPDIVLHVVGDNSAVSLQQLDSDRIQYHGRIDNLDDIYNSARVFIAPTRFAAGIPHKIHEAAARGLPCVTTELLAEQLDWQHHCQLLAGDSPREFADNCLLLYRDINLWNKIRDSALQSVSAECSTEAFKSALLRLFE